LQRWKCMYYRWLRSSLRMHYYSGSL